MSDTSDDHPNIGINHLTVVPRNFETDEDDEDDEEQEDTEMETEDDAKAFSA